MGHGMQRNKKCPTCGKLYASSDALDAHTQGCYEYKIAMDKYKSEKHE